MKICGINSSQSLFKNSQIRFKNSINNNLLTINQPKNNGISPHYYPLLNVNNIKKSQISFKGAQSVPPANIPGEITEAGFNYHCNVTLLDKDGNPLTGYAFLGKGEAGENQIIHILITDEEFDDIGILKAGIGYDEAKTRYASISYNNYANIYEESSCDFNSPIKKYGDKTKCPKRYKRVGTELCRVFEEYVKENYPETKYIEACPVRRGSRLLLEKMGYSYDRNVTEEPPLYWGEGSFVYSYDYYRKYLNKKVDSARSRGRNYLA